MITQLLFMAIFLWPVVMSPLLVFPIYAGMTEVIPPGSSQVALRGTPPLLDPLEPWRRRWRSSGTVVTPGPCVSDCLLSIAKGPSWPLCAQTLCVVGLWVSGPTLLGHHCDLVWCCITKRVSRLPTSNGSAFLDFSSYSHGDFQHRSLAEVRWLTSFQLRPGFCMLIRHAIFASARETFHGT